MKTKRSKNLLTACSLAFFALLAIGSAKVNKIHCDAFAYRFPQENESMTNCIIMNDGRQINVDHVSLRSTVLVAGGKKYPAGTTRGYYSGGAYFARVSSVGYARRIIHGKINVYFKRDYYTRERKFANTNDKIIESRYICKHYAQIGDNGKPFLIANQKAIEKLVSDCPQAVALINKSDKELREAIKNDSNYLNNIFLIYNNGCKQP